MNSTRWHRMIYYTALSPGEGCGFGMMLAVCSSVSDSFGPMSPERQVYSTVTSNFVKIYSLAPVTDNSIFGYAGRIVTIKPISIAPWCHRIQRRWRSQLNFRIDVALFRYTVHDVRIRSELLRWGRLTRQRRTAVMLAALCACVTFRNSALGTAGAAIMRM